MPHVNIHINREKTEVVEWFKANKKKLGPALATITGYDPEQIAVIGHLIDPELCDNILDIEFVLNLGKNRYHEMESIANQYVRMIAGERLGAVTTDWGVWACPNRDTSYVSYKPPGGGISD